MNTVVIVLAAALLMMVLEYRVPGRRFQSSAYWWPRAIAFSLVQAAFVFIAASTWDPWLRAWSILEGERWPLTWQVIAGYLLITFVYYWWHRARHESQLLWRYVHQLHHSPTRIEVATSFYKHPAEICANSLLTSLILQSLLGLSPQAIGITVMVTGLAELFYHWNVKTPYWLGFIFQRPESHCIHHQEGYHRNNYSDLPLWDMLFGTFENPRTQPDRCGFSEQRELKLLDLLRGRDVHSDKQEMRS